MAIYRQITPQFRKSFFSLLKSYSKIVITTHFSPDDDAISSVLSLYHLITSKYQSKDVKIIISGKYNERFSSFHYFDHITFVPDLLDNIEPDSLIIAVDGSQYERFSNIWPTQKIDNHLICIDHHQTPPDKFNLIAQCSTSSSTAELIYQLDSKFQKDKVFCGLILLGILGDTGTFNYIKPGQYHVLGIVEKILNITKIDIQEFKSKYNYITFEGFKTIQEFSRNTTFHQVGNWPPFTISLVSREFVRENNLTDSQVSEGSDIFVSIFTRTIKGFPWGISIKPRSDGSCGLSLRSLPESVNVRKVMETTGFGGGHNRASGGTVKSEEEDISPEEAKEILLNWIKQNQPILD